MSHDLVYSAHWNFTDNEATLSFRYSTDRTDTHSITARLHPQVWAFPADAVHLSSHPREFGLLALLGLLTSFTSTLMFTAMGSFFNRISDPDMVRRPAQHRDTQWWLIVTSLAYARACYMACKCSRAHSMLAFAAGRGLFDSFEHSRQHGCHTAQAGHFRSHRLALSPHLCGLLQPSVSLSMSS